jgi:four helix bundle protein
MSDEREEIQKGDLRQRTKAFAMRALKLYSSLGNQTAEQVLGKQLLRSGTSVGAHYREAQRARSPAEFISKIEVALQELEESDYWIELLVEARFVKHQQVANLQEEIQELLAMLTASVRTTKQHRNK